ncbi:MAG: PEP-CTERM sorting domain-containing protein [Phycisphaerae bacterium]
MLKKITLSAGLIAVAGMSVAAPHVSADMLLSSTSVVVGIPDTAAGTNDNGYPLNGSLRFDFYNDKLTITINNTSAPKSVMEAIYGVEFSLNNFSGILSLDNSTTVGSETAISKGGAYISTGPYSNDVSPANQLANPWTFSGTGSYTLEVGSGQPHDLVIGPADSAGQYVSANTSLAGNGPHNPFLASGAMFTLNDTGSSITDLTGLSGKVTVLYGTGPSSYALSSSQFGLMAVPVPGTLPLFVGGMLGLIALRKRRLPPLSR